MFAQAAWSTLWLITFRAGPQDFPYSPHLLRLLAPIAALANFLVFRIVGLSAPAALFMALAAIAALALVTHSVLRARSLTARFTQTFDALLATAAVFTFALLIPLDAIAPVLQEIARNPEAFRDKPPPLPNSAVWTMNLLNFWNFAVTAHIFRHAASVNLWIGVAIALIVTLAVLFMMILVGSLVTALAA